MKNKDGMKETTFKSEELKAEFTFKEDRIKKIVITTKSIEGKN